jgi:hypothetical protein
MDSRLVDVASLGNVATLQSNSRICTAGLQQQKPSECVRTDPETRNFVLDFKNTEIIMQNAWLLNVTSEYQLGRHRIITLHTI